MSFVYREEIKCSKGEGGSAEEAACAVQWGKFLGNLNEKLFFFVKHVEGAKGR